MAVDVARAAKSACSTMQAAVTMLQRPLAIGPTDTASGKQDMAAAAEALKVEVAKCAVLWGSDPPPAGEAATSALDTLQQRALHICMLCHALSAGGGPTLRDGMLRFVQGVMDAVAAFVRGAVVDNIRGDGLHRLAGQAMHSCDAARRLPLSNKAALTRRLGEALRGMNDAVREAQELLASPAARTELGEEAEAEASGSGSEYEFSPEQLSEHEAAVAASAVELQARAASVLKLVGRRLLEGSEPRRGEEALDAWESVGFHSGSLCRAVEELGAGLYPPQSAAELSSAAEALVISAELLAEEAPEVTMTRPGHESSSAPAALEGGGSAPEQPHATPGSSPGTAQSGDFQGVTRQAAGGTGAELARGAEMARGRPEGGNGVNLKVVGEAEGAVAAATKALSSAHEDLRARLEALEQDCETRVGENSEG